MTNSSQDNGNSLGAGSVAIGFVIGALVGAGLALLLAPSSGKDTRQKLADTGRRLGGAARDKLDDARAAANDLGDQAKSALAAGREALHNGEKSAEPLVHAHPDRRD